MGEVRKIYPHLDSFQKFANDVFAGKDEAFKNVHPQDRDEVRAQFARQVAESADKVGLLMVYPLHMSDKFKAAKHACVSGYSVSQIKVRDSGRIYWAAFAFAEAQQKAA